MKRTKKLYLLCVVFLFIAVSAFIISNMEERKEKIKNSDEIILNIDTDKVKGLSWEYDDKKMAFHKVKKWQYDDDEKFPVNKKKIESMLEQFQEFGVSFVIEEVEDFGQYGLDEPECTITIEEEEKTYEILLGDYSTMDSERYVSIGDGNVYLVKKDPLEKFDVEIEDMIQHDKIPEFEDVKEIHISGSEELIVVYDEEQEGSYCEEDVYYAKIDSEMLPLDTGNITSYLDTLTDLNPKNYVTYDASEETLKQYGLDKPEFTIEIRYEKEEKEKSFTLSVGKEEEEKSYIRINDSKLVYEIESDDREELLDAGYDSWRHRELVTAAMEDISSIDVVLEEESYTIEVKEKNNDMVCVYKGEEQEDSHFIDKLQYLEADSFTDEEKSEKEEVNLTLHFKDEKYPDQKITIYRYDGLKCLVAMGGEPHSLVERTSAVDLIEAIREIILNEQ